MPGCGGWEATDLKGGCEGAQYAGLESSMRRSSDGREDWKENPETQVGLINHVKTFIRRAMVNH